MIMKNWKTTLFGGLAAVVIAVQPLIATGSIDWKAVGLAALVAAFSFFAKDANVTGGTVQQ
jgi:hypothetical protein